VRRRITALVLTAALCAPSFGCARTQGAIVATGRVSDDLVTVQAPPLATPGPSIDAGFQTGSSALAPSTAENRGAVPTMTALTGVGTVSRVESVTVSVGQTVGAGQPIATFETAALSANVAVARANHRVARAQVPVLSQAIEDTRDADDEIADSRATVSSAIRQLNATRPQLVAQRAQLKALLEQLERMPQAPPGGGTAPKPTPMPMPGGQAIPTPAQLRAGIAQIDAGLEKIDSGLDTARSGLRKLNDASATVADARSQLEGLRRLARIARDASEVGVNLARYRESMATVVAPCDGVVVGVVDAGDVLAPGATVAVIRRTRGPEAETWLAAEDVARVGVGDEVTLSADWFASGERRRGVVRRIGTRAEHPPTSFATADVHMTRAIPVEISIVPERGAPALPPGAPLDLIITPRSTTTTP